MSDRNDPALVAATDQRGKSLPSPALVEPILRSPYVLRRWEIDRPMPAELGRQISSGFCGALLRHLGAAVEAVVVRDRLGVLALPKLPVPAKPEVTAVALMTPRNPCQENSEALGQAASGVGRRGFSAGGCDLHLKPESSTSEEAQRWTGPSRIWTSVTPWVSESGHAKGVAEHRQRCLLESLSLSFSRGGDLAARLDTESLVDEVQVHDEAWISGIAPASQLPEFRPGPPAHVRLTFAGAVEGPIVLGRDRLFGMGLLVPLDVPVGPLG